MSEAADELELTSVDVSKPLFYHGARIQLADSECEGLTYVSYSREFDLLAAVSEAGLVAIYRGSDLVAAHLDVPKGSENQRVLVEPVCRVSVGEDDSSPTLIAASPDSSAGGHSVGLLAIGCAGGHLAFYDLDAAARGEEKQVFAADLPDEEFHEVKWRGSSLFCVCVSGRLFRMDPLKQRTACVHDIMDFEAELVAADSSIPVVILSGGTEDFRFSALEADGSDSWPIKLIGLTETHEEILSQAACGGLELLPKSSTSDGGTDLACFFFYEEDERVQTVQAVFRLSSDYKDATLRVLGMDEIFMETIEDWMCVHSLWIREWGMLLQASSNSSDISILSCEPKCIAEHSVQSGWAAIHPPEGKQLGCPNSDTQDALTMSRGLVALSSFTGEVARRGSAEKDAAPLKAPLVILIAASDGSVNFHFSDHHLPPPAQPSPGPLMERAPATSATEPSKSSSTPSPFSPSPFSASTFSGAASGAGLFGGAAVATSSGSPFGASAGASSPFSGTALSSGAGLFGGSANTSGSPFGPSAGGPSPFSGTTSSGGTGLFGGSTSTSASPFGASAGGPSPFSSTLPSSGAGLFGGGAGTAASPFGPSAGTPSLFSATPPSSGSGLFMGAASTSTSPSGGPLASSAGSSSSGMFGASSGSAGSTGMFSGAASSASLLGASAGGGLFGSSGGISSSSIKGDSIGASTGSVASLFSSSSAAATGASFLSSGSGTTSMFSSSGAVVASSSSGLLAGSSEGEAASASPLVEEVRGRITAIYEEQNPQKVQEVPTLLQKYLGKEQELYLKICKKYNVTPVPLTHATAGTGVSSSAPLADSSTTPLADSSGTSQLFAGTAPGPSTLPGGALFGSSGGSSLFGNAGGSSSSSSSFGAIAASGGGALFGNSGGSSLFGNTGGSSSSSFGAIVDSGGGAPSLFGSSSSAHSTGGTALFSSGSSTSLFGTPSVGTSGAGLGGSSALFQSSPNAACPKETEGSASMPAPPVPALTSGASSLFGGAASSGSALAVAPSPSAPSSSSWSENGGLLPSGGTLFGSSSTSSSLGASGGGPPLFGSSSSAAIVGTAAPLASGSSPSLASASTLEASGSSLTGNAGGASMKPSSLVEEVKDRITAIYTEQNPQKVQEVPDLLKKYLGKEQELYLKICKKYNVTPVPLKESAQDPVSSASSATVSSGSLLLASSAPKPGITSGDGLFGSGGGSFGRSSPGNSSSGSSFDAMASGGGSLFGGIMPAASSSSLLGPGFSPSGLLEEGQPKASTSAASTTAPVDMPAPAAAEEVQKRQLEAGKIMKRMEGLAESSNILKTLLPCFEEFERALKQVEAESYTLDKPSISKKMLSSSERKGLDDKLGEATKQLKKADNLGVSALFSSLSTMQSDVMQLYSSFLVAGTSVKPGEAREASSGVTRVMQRCRDIAASLDSLEQEMADALRCKVDWGPLQLALSTRRTGGGDGKAACSIEVPDLLFPGSELVLPGSDQDNQASRLGFGGAWPASSSSSKARSSMQQPLGAVAKGPPLPMTRPRNPLKKTSRGKKMVLGDLAPPAGEGSSRLLGGHPPAWNESSKSGNSLWFYHAAAHSECRRAEELNEQIYDLTRQAKAAVASAEEGSASRALSLRLAKADVDCPISAQNQLRASIYTQLKSMVAPARRRVKRSDHLALDRSALEQCGLAFPGSEIDTPTFGSHRGGEGDFGTSSSGVKGSKASTSLGASAGGAPLSAPSSSSWSGGCRSSSSGGGIFGSTSGSSSGGQLGSNLGTSSGGSASLFGSSSSAAATAGNALMSSATSTSLFGPGMTASSPSLFGTGMPGTTPSLSGSSSSSLSQAASSGSSADAQGRAAMPPPPVFAAAPSASSSSAGLFGAPTASSGASSSGASTGAGALSAAPSFSASCGGSGMFPSSGGLFGSSSAGSSGLGSFGGGSSGVSLFGGSSSSAATGASLLSSSGGSSSSASLFGASMTGMAAATGPALACGGGIGAAAGGASSLVEEVKERITTIYTQHNPQKVQEVPDLLKKYLGKEQELYLKICKKYNVAPVPLTQAAAASSVGGAAACSAGSSLFGSTAPSPSFAAGNGLFGSAGGSFGSASSGASLFGTACPSTGAATGGFGSASSASPFGAGMAAATGMPMSFAPSPFSTPGAASSGASLFGGMTGASSASPFGAMAGGPSPFGGASSGLGSFSSGGGLFGGASASTFGAPMGGPSPFGGGAPAAGGGFFSQSSSASPFGGAGMAGAGMAGAGMAGAGMAAAGNPGFPCGCGGVAANGGGALAEQVKQRIMQIYAQYNPQKIQEVPNLLNKYLGKEQELYLKICKKYNVPP